jgi:hypothetical protein
VLDLQEWKQVQRELTHLQATGPSPEEVASLRPEHALYVSIHNWATGAIELLQELPALGKLVDRIAKADEEYMPGGPPMSPLTRSFFWSWMLYDVSFGTKQETVGAILHALAGELGLEPGFMAVLARLSESRLGLFIHEGVENENSILKEKVTGEVHHCICPAGYAGHRGEVWLARVLPPPAPGLRSLIFTTPYVILEPGVEAWQHYFDRTLPKTKRTKPEEAYAYLMKRGLAWNYWAEYVFEAYAGHRAEVIFLQGLPDVARSRPHSRVNSRLL